MTEETKEKKDQTIMFIENLSIRYSEEKMAVKRCFCQD
jgi:hypothetical protein